jgi:hypothetical protein
MPTGWHPGRGNVNISYRKTSHYGARLGRAHLGSDVGTGQSEAMLHVSAKGTPTA